MATMDRKGPGEELDLRPTASFRPEDANWRSGALSFGHVGFKMHSHGANGTGETDYPRTLCPAHCRDGDPRRRDLLPRRKGRTRPPLSAVDPVGDLAAEFDPDGDPADGGTGALVDLPARDRKSTRLNSSHGSISY